MVLDVLCCCMHLCSSFCDSGGVLGVCGAMASVWSREDFFRLASTDIHKLKLQLAQKCDIHYDTCNQDKDMGSTSNGVMGLKAATLADRVKAMQETMGDNTLSAQQSSKLLDAHTFATVISGCHVKWATTTVLNTGYIMEAGTTMVGCIMGLFGGEACRWLRHWCGA